MVFILYFLLKQDCLLLSHVKSVQSCYGVPWYKGPKIFLSCHFILGNFPFLRSSHGPKWLQNIQPLHHMEYILEVESKGLIK